ncbi:MAG: 6,7-dimethyl-8-ribityllumazine synthase [Fimbriimonadaceae bacterium]
MRLHEGLPNGDGLRVLVVASRWNELVTSALVEGALDELAKLGTSDITVVWVPGSWETPLAVQTAMQEQTYSAVVALGCVMQGQTSHAGLLASDVSSALMRIQLETGVPVGWGILTPETTEQALDRAGMKMGHKGREAVLAALTMADLLRKLREKG